jgi:hypothetical protein
MAGPSKTLGSSWSPLAIRPWGDTQTCQQAALALSPRLLASQKVGSLSWHQIWLVIDQTHFLSQPVLMMWRMMQKQRDSSAHFYSLPLEKALPYFERIVDVDYFKVAVMCAHRFTSYHSQL